MKEGAPLLCPTPHMHWVNTLLPTAPPIKHSSSLPHRLCVWERETDREREESNRWRQTDRRPECVCVTVCEWNSSYTATRTHIHSPEKTGNVCVCFLMPVCLWSLGFWSTCAFFLFVSTCLVLADVLFK